MNQKGNKSKLKNDLFPFFLWFVLVPIITSCITPFTPQSTLEERQLKREEVVEGHLASKLAATKKYASLGFGPLNVIKPPAFVSLDSLYDIKYAYLENNDLKEYKLSGIEDLIEDYKVNAQNQKHLLKYELEHIYTTDAKDSITIHHDYFILQLQHSLLFKEICAPLYF